MNTKNDICTTTAEDTQEYIEIPEWNADQHEKGVDLKVTLPGVSKDDLSVEIVDSHLVLEAKRASSTAKGRLIQGAPSPDGYRLRLRLGASLDGSSLTARLENGVLEISVPLKESAQPRKIEVL